MRSGGTAALQSSAGSPFPLPPPVATETGRASSMFSRPQASSRAANAANFPRTWMSKQLQTNVSSARGGDAPGLEDWRSIDQVARVTEQDRGLRPDANEKTGAQPELYLPAGLRRGIVAPHFGSSVTASQPAFELTRVDGATNEKRGDYPCAGEYSEFSDGTERDVTIA